jgi:hypothetical protein
LGKHAKPDDYQWSAYSNTRDIIHLNVAGEPQEEVSTKIKKEC